MNSDRYVSKLLEYIRIETEKLTFWSPIAFAVGCIVYFVLPYEPSIKFCLVAFSIISIFLLGIYFFYHQVSLELYHLTWVCWLMIVGFCLSYWQTHRQEPFYQVPARATVIQGEVDQVEHLSTGKTRLIIQNFHFLIPPEMDQHVWQRKLQLTLSSKDQQSLVVGDIIKVKVMLSRPSPPIVIGGYDLQFHAWFHQIGAYGYALKPVKIIHSQHSVDSLQSLREHIAHHIRQVLPDNSGVIVQILLTGIGSELSQQDRHAFAVSGLSHLLAIAGLHLGIIMASVTYIVRWLLLRSEYVTLYWPIKKIALISGWITGCCYLILTGMHLPAIRSLVMATVFLLAIFYQRRSFSMHNLMIAALFLLLLSPASVLNVSFQMSMAAVMALIAGYGYCYYAFVKTYSYSGFSYKTYFSYIKEYAIVSLLAGSAVVPIVMAYFHEIDLYFIIANLIAVPLMMFFVMPLGILVLITMGMGWDVPFLKLMGFGTKVIIDLAYFIADLPYSSISIPYFPAWGIAIYFLGLCILCLCTTPLRFVGIGFIVVGITSYLWIKLPDIVTTSDGRMIGWVDQGILRLVCQKNCNARVVDQWKKYFNINENTILSPFHQGEKYRCDENYCKLSNGKVLVVLTTTNDKPFDNSMCSGVLWELSFGWNSHFCSNAQLVNKQSNWVNGSHAIWLQSNQVQTDLDYRGDRPWVMEPIQRGAPKLPMVESE